MENLFDFLIFCLCYCLLCRRRNKHFDVQFRRIRPVDFPSKDGKDADCEGRNGGKCVFSHHSLHISFVIFMIKVLSRLCTLTWRVNNFFPAKEKVYLGQMKALNIDPQYHFDYQLTVLMATSWLF